MSDRLHIIDASRMTAKVDLFRLKKEHQEGDDDDHYVDRNSPDPDARFGRKTAKKGFYGYKYLVVQDADSDFLVQVKTTPGNVPDGVILPTLAQPQARELTGDKAYDSTARPIATIWQPWEWRPASSGGAPGTPISTGARHDRTQVSWPAPGPPLGPSQGGHPNPHGGPGGQPQTLGHPPEAAKSSLLLGLSC